MSGEISLLAAVVCFYLVHQRRQTMTRLEPAQVPELSADMVATLRGLLAAAYQRLAYLGAAFGVFALFTFTGRPAESRAVFLLLIAGLAVANVVPRWRAMRLLASAGIDLHELRQRGIVL